MKIKHKLSLAVSSAIFIVFLLNIFANNFIFGKFYFWSKKIELSKIVEKIQDMDIDFINGNIERLESEYGLNIIYVPYENNLDILNENIRIVINKKKMPIGKFWFGEELENKLKKDQYASVLYHQEKIKSAMLTTFFIKDKNLLMIGLPIPYIKESVGMLNRIMLGFMISAFLLNIMIVFVLIKKILKPLELINVFGQKTAKLDFGKIEINTKDEFEELALNMNIMSDKLKKAYEELNAKNIILNQLISDVSHELKTPISLIQAYSIGIKDGLDDGTFVETIINQADSLNLLTNSLLMNSKSELTKLKYEKVNLKDLFQNINREFQLEYIRRGIELEVEGLDQSYIECDVEKISSVFRNLISNGIKYTSNHRIEVSFNRVEEGYVDFWIRNGIEREIPCLDKLWEAFYVEEESRDKKLSGTGLGLYIVKNILELHKYYFFVEQNNHQISFLIRFPLELNIRK